MPKKANPIPNEIAEYFDYKDGQLIRIKATAKNAKQWLGATQGYLTAKGYRVIKFKGRRIPVHRLVWFLVHGELSTELQIDHIDGDKTNNKIENLRLATNAQNVSATRKTGGATGVRNVYKSPSGKKFVVYVSGKNFGTWGDKELAELVAKEARDHLHGEFANHG